MRRGFDCCAGVTITQDALSNFGRSLARLRRAPHQCGRDGGIVVVCGEPEVPVLVLAWSAIICLMDSFRLLLTPRPSGYHPLSSIRASAPGGDDGLLSVVLRSRSLREAPKAPCMRFQVREECL